MNKQGKSFGGFGLLIIAVLAFLYFGNSLSSLTTSFTTNPILLLIGVALVALIFTSD